MVAEESNFSVFIIYLSTRSLLSMSLQYYHAYWLAETSRTGQENYPHRLSFPNNMCSVRWKVLPYHLITARNATIAYGVKREIKNLMWRVLLFMWSRWILIRFTSEKKKRCAELWLTVAIKTKHKYSSSVSNIALTYHLPGRYNRADYLEFK